MKNTCRIIISILTFLQIAVEIHSFIVHRSTVDSFDVGTQNCSLFNAIRTRHICQCSTGTFFSLTLKPYCKPIRQECSQQFENILVNPNEKIKLRSGCRSCNSVEGVFLWDTELSPVVNRWIDVTTEALFDNLYNKKSKELDLTNLSFYLWRGQLVKIKFNGKDNCAIYKMQGMVQYPLPTNVKEILFGKDISTTTVTTLTKSTTTKATVTTTTTKTPTKSITKTPITEKHTTPATLTTTTTPRSGTTKTPVKSDGPNSSSFSSPLVQTTPRTMDKVVVECEEKSLPVWVYGIIVVLFLVVLVLSLAVVWMCRERKKVLKDDRVTMVGNESRANSVYSLNLLSQNSLNSTSDESRKTSQAASQNSSNCKTLTSVANPEYNIYLTPVDNPKGNSDTNDVYAPLQQYTTDIYADSTLVAVKETNSVYADPKEKLKKSHEETNNIGPSLYAELGKEEFYAELEEETPQQTSVELYTSLGHFNENVYA